MFSANGTESILRTGGCGDLDAEPTRLEVRPTLLAVEVDSEWELRSVVWGLRRTILFCPTEIRTGVYAPNNVILYLVGAGGDLLSPLRSIIFGDPEVRRHARVAVVSLAQPGCDKLAIHRYNIFAGRIETTNVYTPHEAAPL